MILCRMSIAKYFNCLVIQNKKSYALIPCSIGTSAKKLKRDAPDSKLEDVAAFATLKLGHKGV